MLRVFVALGKQLPKSKAMIEDTEEVARLLAKYNCTMVQGGARTGLMGTVVSEFQKYSDEVVMIVPEVHKADLEGTTSKEHYIVEGEADRLKITINTCDLMIVLPGGTGTLAELAFYNETGKNGEHRAKLVMLNTKGFYNPLIKFFKQQTKYGFMQKEHFTFEVINNAKQVEAILQQLITEKQTALQQAELDASKESVIEDAKEVAKIEVLESENAPKSTKKVSAKNKVKSTAKASAKSSTKDAKTKVEDAKVSEAEEVKTKSTSKAKEKDVESNVEKPKATKVAKASAKSTKAKAKEEKDEVKVEVEPKKTSAKKATTKATSKTATTSKNNASAKSATAKTSKKPTVKTASTKKATTKKTAKK